MRELFSLPVSSTDQHDVRDRNNADSRALSSFAQSASSSLDVKVRVAKSKPVGPPESNLLGRGYCARFGNPMLDGQGESTASYH